MSAAAANLDSVEIARAAAPALESDIHDEKRAQHASDSDISSDLLVGPNGERYPTDEELKTLRRTQGHVPWIIYTIGFVELCERFAYYGTTIVCESQNQHHEKHASHVLTANTSSKLH